MGWGSVGIEGRRGLEMRRRRIENVIEEINSFMESTKDSRTDCKS
jgi:hypothetical protein